MTRHLRFVVCAVAAALAFGLSGRAEAPRTYAIKGARIVTVSGDTLSSPAIISGMRAR